MCITSEYSRGINIVIQAFRMVLWFALSPEKVLIRKGAEYGFGEHGFRHRAQWVFWTSPSFGERAQWVPLSLFVCGPKWTHWASRRTHRVCRRTQWVLSSKTVLSKRDSARFLIIRDGETIIKIELAVLRVGHWGREEIVQYVFLVGNLETGIGGVKSPKIRGGGWKFWIFRGPWIWPFSTERFYRKSPIWGSKVQVFEGQLSGRVPPPLAFGTFWPPLSRFPRNVTTTNFESAHFIVEKFCCHCAGSYLRIFQGSNNSLESHFSEVKSIFEAIVDLENKL